jgi:hypothetical protein
MLKQGCHLFGWQPNTADWQPALPPPDKHGDSSGNQQLMHVCDLKKRTKRSRTHTPMAFRAMSPAGIRPAGAETDRQSPERGEVAAATESIEPALHTNLKLANPSGMRNNVPGGNGVRGSGAT